MIRLKHIASYNTHFKRGIELTKPQILTMGGFESFDKWYDNLKRTRPYPGSIANRGFDILMDEETGKHFVLTYAGGTFIEIPISDFLLQII